MADSKDLVEDAYGEAWAALNAYREILRAVKLPAVAAHVDRLAGVLPKPEQIMPHKYSVSHG